jgi:hypothetical protein
MSAVTIRIYPDSLAAMNIERAGAKYRPGNGTEGELFIESWCGQCERDHGMMKGLPLEECDDNQVCDIIARTFAFSVNDPNYPDDWQYGADGQPRCHSFVEAGHAIPIKDELTVDMFLEAP